MRKRLAHTTKLICRPSYRKEVKERKRLCALPRYQPTTTRFLGKEMQLVDGVTFVAGVDEIFQQKIYEFNSTSEIPLILDCGANIGLSVIYFKRLYPRSKVIAFEADPHICRAAELNIQAFNLSEVTLHNAAVWTSSTPVRFQIEGGASGRVVESPDGAGDVEKVVVVHAIHLRNLLSDCGPVDLLKLDIEGAETDVLMDCADHLSGVKHLFVEYHSVVGQSQTLDKLLSILSQAGFRYYLREAYCPRQPFIERTQLAGMDFQVNVFAIRP